ncbi:MFS transporter [Actinomadura rugatobispora]|uniref:MFS transporter n=1 Tax=Actinomadura rugatobispora TaxID=1994 RepID=A0ABW0ZQ11_9ACTN|nr:hypothetical protein GCM10010200_060220 [Actinomadura rugatobispora]
MPQSKPMTLPAPPLGLVPSGGRAADRRVVMVMVAVQCTAALGFWAVMTHLVAHLRHDVGLLAGTAGTILAVRVGVQYALLLPVGTVTDMLGPARAGAIACGVRAAGFTLLGFADGPAELVAAAVLLGAGGALFHPAAQSLLAGLAPGRRARGFAAYVITGQAAAVAGPPLGLLVLSLGSGAPAGFTLLATLAGGAWAVASVLFLLLLGHRPPRSNGGGAGARLRELAANVRAVVADRAFLAFALATAPTTLLADHTTVVPLKGFTSGAATLFFCVLAATAAAVQPWVAARGRGERPWTLRCGLLLAGAAYLTLALLDGARSPLGWLLAAAVLAGAGNGLLQASVFQRVARLAAPERFGSYFGVLSFVSGMFAAAGGMAVGRLFDFGGTGATAALLGLAALGAATAALCGGRRYPYWYDPRS